MGAAALSRSFDRFSENALFLQRFPRLKIYLEPIAQPQDWQQQLTPK